MRAQVSHRILLGFSDSIITFSVGATEGGEDSIKTIFNMAQEGIVADSTGKKVFQVGLGCTSFPRKDYLLIVRSTAYLISLCNTLRELERWAWAQMRAFSRRRWRCSTLLQDSVFNAYLQRFMEVDELMWVGYLDIIRNVYKVCCRKLQHGEKNEIFIFGFSRGACECSSVIIPQPMVVPF